MEYIGHDFASATSGTSKAVPIPVGVAVGDLAFLHVYVAATAVASLTTPTGWTFLTSNDGVTLLGSTFLYRQAVYYRVLTGSEGSSVTFTWSATTLTAFQGIVSAHRGALTSGGITDSGPATAGASGLSVTATYGPTTLPNSRVLAFAAVNASAAATAAFSESSTPSFYDQSSEFRSAYSETPSALLLTQACVYLDQTLPGSGSVTYGYTGLATPIWRTITVAVAATDTSTSPGVDSKFGLVTQAPPRAVGVLMDPTNVADWAPRLSVQLASPSPDDGAYWDVSEWDVDGWGAGYQWYDATGLVRGLHWERGAQQPGARPETGTASLTFDNLDGALSPWATTGDFQSGGVTWFRAGLLVRLGVTVFHDGVYEYLPFFTGTIESIDEGSSVNVDSWVTVTAVETIADLAGSNDAALSVAVGAGDTLAARIASLLLAAGWEYGSDVSGGIADGTFQATTMSSDKLTEIYLTVDSVYARAVAGSGGLLRVTDFDPDSGVDPLTFSNDPSGDELPLEEVQPYAATDRLLNRAVGSRAGGTQQQYDDAVSQGKFQGVYAQGYGFPRDDLICATDATVLAVLTAVVGDHADDDLGLSSVTLNADMDKVNLYRVLAQYAALGVEYRQPLTVRWVHPTGASLTIDLRVDGFTFDLVGLDPAVPMAWTSTITTARNAT